MVVVVVVVLLLLLLLVLLVVVLVLVVVVVVVDLERERTRLHPYGCVPAIGSFFFFATGTRQWAGGRRCGKRFPKEDGFV